MLSCMQNSTVSLMTAIVVAIVVFLLGVAWAAAKGARKNYQTIKGGVGPARKAYWAAVGGIVKIGVWVAVLLIALVAWQVNDVRKAGHATPTPSPSVSHR
jgi:cytochrome bd-type quinol oxidase subunit 2